MASISDLSADALELVLRCYPSRSFSRVCRRWRELVERRGIYPHCMLHGLSSLEPASGIVERFQDAVPEESCAPFHNAHIFGSSRLSSHPSSPLVAYLSSEKLQCLRVSPLAWVGALHHNVSQPCLVLVTRSSVVVASRSFAAAVDAKKGLLNSRALPSSLKPDLCFTQGDGSAVVLFMAGGACQVSDCRLEARVELPPYAVVFQQLSGHHSPYLYFTLQQQLLRMHVGESLAAGEVRSTVFSASIPPHRMCSVAYTCLVTDSGYVLDANSAQVLNRPGSVEEKHVPLEDHHRKVTVGSFCFELKPRFGRAAVRMLELDKVVLQGASALKRSALPLYVTHMDGRVYVVWRNNFVDVECFDDSTGASLWHLSGESLRYRPVRAASSRSVLYLACEGLSDNSLCWLSVSMRSGKLMGTRKV